jgi:hypothetical protein
MNDVGRLLFCQLLDKQMEDDDVRVQCEGSHKQAVVIVMKDAQPIELEKIQLDEVIEHMSKPYHIALEGLEGLILTGNKFKRRAGTPVPTNEIKRRLNALGAKTIGDFYAACGFEEFIIRDEQDNIEWLKITFSSKDYGKNPVKHMLREQRKGAVEQSITSHDIFLVLKG